MKTLFLLTIIYILPERLFCQQNTVQSLDSITLAIDKYSDLFCFKYSDTVHRNTQFTTREVKFLSSSRRNPDTLKIIEIFRDSGSTYNPIESRYYYIQGKPIKRILLRTNQTLEVTQTNIYFLGKSEVVEGAKLPDVVASSHKQSTEHMYQVYKRFIKNKSDLKLPRCR